MMPSLSDLLEHESRTIDLEPESFERLRRRRDRKRRNQRITAGLVGIAVFVAAIWIVTSGGWFDRSQTSVGPAGEVSGPAETGQVETGPAETGPAFVAPTPPDEWNGSALPPEATTLSTPVEGQPIRRVSDYHHYLVVYADGRVLWWNDLRSPTPSGPGGGDYVLERRLTPEGVDLLRSGAIKAADLAPPQVLHGVPASVWVDAEARPYAPARYSICFWANGVNRDPSATDLPPAVDLLPAAVKDVLRGDDPDPLHPGCLVVSTEEARALYEILSEMGFTPATDLGGVTPGATVGAWLLRGVEPNLGQQVGIYLRPLWPDGEWHELYLA
jgi:hypothetical protein